jgi:hypothetical protein
MVRQPSETETKIAAKVGASLTPRIVVNDRRGAQNSGMVNIAALYASSVEIEEARQRAERAEQAVRAERARRAAAEAAAHAATAQAAQQARAVAAYAAVARRQARGPQYADRTPEVYEDVDLAGEYMVIPGVGSHGPIGWFAVAVAWLATTTLAAGVATLVPAHGMKRVLAPVVAAAVAPVPAPANLSAPAAAPAAVPGVSGVAAVEPTKDARDANGIPTVSLSSLAPVAAPGTAPATAPAPATPAATVNKVATPAQTMKAKAARPRAAAPAADAPAVAPVAKAAPVADAEPAPKAVAPKAAAAPAAPAAAGAPAAGGGGSLEDLIRAAVAKESKHPTAKPIPTE